MIYFSSLVRSLSFILAQKMAQKRVFSYFIVVGTGLYTNRLHLLFTCELMPADHIRFIFSLIDLAGKLFESIYSAIVFNDFLEKPLGEDPNEMQFQGGV